MIVHCLKDKLKDAISKTEKTSTNNPSMPILSCIYLKAEGSVLIFRSTNLDVGVESSVSCKVEQEGEIAVPAQLLKSVISSIIQDGSIELRVEGNSLIIKTNNTLSTILSYDTADFPTLPKSDEGIKMNIASEVFVSGLKSVVYSTAQTSMKPEFSSIYMYREDSRLIFVATDSFRLAESSKIIKDVPEFEPILIPHKTVVELIRLLEGVNGEIELMISTTQLSIKHELLYITARLVEAAYPDYHQIIPKEHGTLITVSKKDFEQALKMSTLFSDKFNKVKFTIDQDKQLFEILSSNAAVGESTTSIPSNIEGEDININFNERYISDVLSSLKGETIKICLTSGRPMIISDVSDSTFQYLVMPVAA